MIGKLFFSLVVLVLPQPVKRFLYRKCLGYEIASSAYIGLSIIAVDNLKLGSNARIGHLNLFKGLVQIEIGDHSSIGNLNWFTGFPLHHKSEHFSQCTERKPSITLGQHTAITNRHLIDCTDSFTLGNFTTFAGFRSQVLTHSIDLKTNRQSAKSVEIGDYCFIGTNCVLLPGAKLPSFSVLSANSLLVQGEFSEEYCLYAGVPAKRVKSLDKSEYQYFQRKEGYVV